MRAHGPFPLEGHGLSHTPSPRTTPEGGKAEQPHPHNNGPPPDTGTRDGTQPHAAQQEPYTTQCGTQPTQGPTIMSNPRNRNGNRRRLLRQRVLAAYDTCAICGKPVDKSLHTPHPLSAEVDEIIPVSRGGDPLSWHNVQLTHRRCNRLKSNKSDDYARAQLTAKPLPKATSLPLTASKW